MSHYHDLGKGAFLNCNSDLSGATIETGKRGEPGHVKIEIDGRKLLSVVATYVRSAKVGALEDASDLEILGLEEEL